MSKKIFCWSAAAALCLGSLMSELASAQQFMAPVPVKITNSAQFPVSGPYIAVADVNGDGRKDILYETVTLLGNSDGSYTAIANGTQNSQNNCSYYQLAGDINGDGRLDLVGIVQPGGDSMGYPDGPSYECLALGNGDGTFRPQPAIALPGIDTLDLLADLNNDGKDELIYSSMACYPNPNPDGCTDSSSSGPTPLVVGDFAGNGYSDLIYPGEGSQIGINNKGTFTYATINPPLNVRLAAVGDLNHDGKLDLVVVGHAAGSNTETGQILLGNGDSTFRPGGTFLPLSDGLIVASVSISDVNGDGLQDIVLFTPADHPPDTFSNTAAELQIFAGNGNGTVVAFPILFNVGDPIQEGLYDLNNDGKPALLSVADSGPYSPAVFAVTKNAGNGFLDAPRITGVYQPNSIVKADFNKDGIDDVAVVSDAPGVFTSNASENGTVVVLPGSDKGYFNTPKSYEIGMASGIVTVGDVNGDGILDLVVTRSAAFAHDLTANEIKFPSQTNDLSVLLGNGDGTFKPAMNFAVLGKPAKGNLDNFATLADVNHDGKLDLIGDWGVALGHGDGTFAAPIPLPASLANITAISVGDFNHDGVPDLLVATSPYTGLNGVTTLLGDGKGGYTINGHQEMPETVGVGGLTVADIDGDGKPDLIFTESYSLKAALVVRLGNGDGTFAAPIIHPLGPIKTPDPVGSGSQLSAQFLVGDFNRDGKPDLLILAPVTEPGQVAGGGVTLYFGLGGGRFTTAPQSFQTSLNQGVVLNLNAGGGLDVVGTTVAGVTRLINTGSGATVTK